MNKSDSALIQAKLEEAGYLSAPAEEASVVIFNTCAVRNNAERRAVARITQAKSYAKRRKQLIVTAGCVAQSRGEELVKKKLTHIAIGPYESPAIVEIIERYQKRHETLFVSQDRRDFQGRIHPSLPVIDHDKPWQQWITITHGCGNFCTYCIVPYARGPLYSFSSPMILEYLHRLADNGVMEIMLLGQNVNQYGQDTGDIPFSALLEKCAQIEQFRKIGFLTSHPKDFSDDLIRVIRDYPNIAKSVHLPLQSGSDKILDLMNRKYTLSRYMRIIEMLKSAGEHSISTDLIVGFPGESEEDFNATLRAVETIQYDEAFMYAYSPRTGTPGSTMADQIDSNVKKERLAALITLQRGISVTKLEAQVGKETSVIPEVFSKKSGNDLAGRTMLNHPVIIHAPESLIGKLLRIKIEGVAGATLRARII